MPMQKRDPILRSAIHPFLSGLMNCVSQIKSVRKPGYRPCCWTRLMAKSGSDNTDLAFATDLILIRIGRVANHAPEWVFDSLVFCFATDRRSAV